MYKCYICTRELEATGKGKDQTKLCIPKFNIQNTVVNEYTQNIHC